MIRPIRTFTVVPSLPENLEKLRELAYNLWWCWDADAIELLRRMDEELWDSTCHNPVQMLGLISQERFDRLSANTAFLAHLERVYQRLQHYMSGGTWYQTTYGEMQDWRIAYFCAEYGITECLRIYSGGLGILAGDHLKSASDLGLPLTGVGLLYQRGYFQQFLNADGWQGEHYPENDFFTMPIQLERDAEGNPVMIQVQHPLETLYAQVWRAQIGRVPLFLLDTNIERNPEPLRQITAQLYGGDQEMRIQQELLLGMGGLRALDVLGLHPTVCHINEGHSAFLILERIRQTMKTYGLSFEEAREATFIGNLFTTHTSVPAGIDIFPPYLIEKYLAPIQRELGLTIDALLALGRQNPGDPNEGFNMAVCALRQSVYRNGVSKLHGVVSRKMWQNLWPGTPQAEIPIRSITNGVHTPSWISHDMADLFDRYLGSAWKEEPENQEVWERIVDIPASELWRTHERRRERLVAFSRKRLREQLIRRGALSSEVAQAAEVLDLGALTIGFARRFATYKRATLLFHDPQRLARILNDPERPVQIIYAGKAHPQDDTGKELIRTIIHQIQKPEFRHHIVFLENYDTCIARYLVGGVDVWLNNPRRLMEASGTSGMKANANGALNISTLDGWWDEVYDRELGWAIGNPENHRSVEEQDRIEANALYTLLEDDVVPLFYERGKDGLPRRWIERMQRSMRAFCPVFNTHRMLDEYTDQCYLTSHHHWQRRAENNFAVARALTVWKRHIRQHWSRVSVQGIIDEPVTQTLIGQPMTIRVRVALGELEPQDIAVEIYEGHIDSHGGLEQAIPIRMEHLEAQGDGIHTYIGTIQFEHSGKYGYTIRVVPDHPELCIPNELGLITWL